MRQTLQLRLGQSLTMTPQLQQAIRLLQLSSLELQQEIQRAIDSNPLLEIDDTPTEVSGSALEPQPEGLREAHAGADAQPTDDPLSATDAALADSGLERPTDNTTAEPLADAQASELSRAESDSPPDNLDALSEATFGDELPLDSNWDEFYAASSTASAALPEGDDSGYLGATREDLHSYLLWQLQLTPFSEVDAALALAIIDAVDESGYLSASLEEIHAAVAAEAPELELALEEVAAVLKRVQHFDPVGVAARSVQECLLIQLQALPEATPWRQEALQVVSEHMDLLALRDYRTLVRKAKLKEAVLKAVMAVILQLEPRPGARFSVPDLHYVIPDVSVQKRNGQWQVELNSEAAPRVRVNQAYAALARGERGSGTSQFIRGHLQEAKWFIKSVESRNETLLKVASCIVARQQAFFEQGEEAMVPLVLNDVAQEVEMHESTISRVTTQKYLHSPRGIFELKYFFSSHVGTQTGGECSSTAIRAQIKKLVAGEDAAKPLSDSKIADLLVEKGVMVARRTIAKYRESLSIPPSNQRKRLV
ncbi:MAG: RNA polymerase factor sigma-54 [Aeromonas sp.]